MTAPRHRPAPQQYPEPAAGPHAIAHAIAMLARIEAATARLEAKFNAVLTGLTALPRQPGARHAPGRLPGGRPSCQGRQPRTRRNPRRAHSRRSQ